MFVVWPGIGVWASELLPPPMTKTVTIASKLTRTVSAGFKKSRMSVVPRISIFGGLPAVYTRIFHIWLGFCVNAVGEFDSTSGSSPAVTHGISIFGSSNSNPVFWALSKVNCYKVMKEAGLLP
jgi:hypothetical protein